MPKVIRTWWRRRDASTPRPIRIAVAVAVGLVGAALVTATPPAHASVPIRCSPTVPSVGGGAFHTMLLDSAGNVRGAGDNYFGQVGDNTRAVRPTAVVASGLTGTTSTASSPNANHSVALKSDGTVWTWGINWWGQLGNGEIDPNGARPTTPTKVAGLSDIVSVAAGSDHSMALTEGGTVWTWGRNSAGQLGDSTTTDSPVPVQVAGLSDVVAISAGAHHSLAVKSNGEVWSWGDNSDGQLGIGTLDYLPHVTPTRVPGVTASAVAGGGRHSLALTTGGTVHGWGYNDVGAVGPGYTAGDIYSPTPTAVLSSVTAIAAGYWHSLALKSDGSVWAWGYSTDGQLGNGAYGSWTGTPTQVSGISGAKSIAAPGAMSVAARNDGALYTWGDNYYGQLGVGDYLDRTAPTRVSGMTQSAPAAPTKVAAVSGEKLALVTWEAPPSAVTQYVVTPYRNGVAQAAIGTKLPKLEYAVPNLASGDTYRFEVKAQNCIGDGAPSARSNAVVPVDAQTDESGFSIEGWDLNDRHSARVNVSNGNLKVTATDLDIDGIGMPLVAARSYNSRAATTTSVFGKNWTSTLGTDVRLEPLPTGSVFFHGPGGSKLGFAKDGTTFSAPAGIDSTLTQDAVTGAYTLKHNASGNRLEFSSTGQLLRNVDNNGNAHAYVYGADARLLKVTDTRGRDLTFTYDTAGRVTSMSDAGARVWRYQYDAGGNLVAYTDPAGGVTKYAYDVAGKLSRLETPAARVVELTYDASGRLAKLVYPKQAARATTCSTNLPRSTTCFDYQAKKTVVTDANGNPTTYNVDAVGRTTQVVDALGNTTSSAYTSNSNVKRRSIGGSTTTFGYTPGNAPAALNMGTGSGYSLEYGDAAHPFRPSAITDPQGNKTFVTYDASGNLRTQKNQLPTQNQVSVERDARGLPTTTADPRNAVTRMTHDTKGHLTTVAPPAPLGPSDVTYDALSRVDVVSDANGNTTDFDYDALDRVTKTTFSDGSTVSYTYDGDGNVVTSTDAVGTVTTTYDDRNNPLTRTTADGVTVAYAYDGVGNLTAITDTAGTVRYSYNAANLLSAVIEPDGDAVVVSYDKDYNRNAIRYPNGVSIFSTYDAAKRLEKISSVDAHLAPLARFEYSHKHPITGHDTSLRQSVKDKDGNVTAYAYDVLNRLVRAKATAPDGKVLHEYTYTYDGAGNRKTQTFFDGLTTTTTTYTYNDANQLVGIDGGTRGSFTYDLNGNFTRSDNGVEHVYNAKDQAVSMRTATLPPVEMRYHGTGQGERMSLGGGAGVPLIGFTNTVLGITQERVAPAVSRNYVRDDTGQLLAQTTGTATYYVLTDGLGSTVGITDDDGALAGTFEYAPFGETRKATGAAEVMPFRFGGGYLDPTGLYKLGERYYDASVGRFTQQDVVHDPLDPKQWNRYAYVGGDPVNFADPTGLSWYNPSTWTKQGSKEWLSCMARQTIGAFNPFGPDLGTAIMDVGITFATAGHFTKQLGGPMTLKSGQVMAGPSRALMRAGRLIQLAGYAGIVIGAFIHYSPCIFS